MYVHLGYVLWCAGRVMWRGQFGCRVAVGDGECVVGYRDILCVSCGGILIVLYGECVLSLILLCLGMITIKGGGCHIFEGSLTRVGVCTLLLR